jgi:cell division septation protein DedD
MRLFPTHWLTGAAALALAAGVAQADVKAGVDLWQRGDFAAAVAEWRPLADNGDADAQYNLGQAYKMGRGVPADVHIAQTWYEKAAQQGHPQAAGNLGIILFQSGQQERAIPWLKMAADADDPRAEYVLGTALFNGDLASAGKDWVRAYALMSRAAAQGFPPAASNLRQMDELVPEAQRRQGLALAAEMERKAGGPSRPVRIAGQPGPRTVISRENALASTMPAPAPVRGAQGRAMAEPPAEGPPVAVHRGAPAPVVHRNAEPPAPAPVAVASAGGGWRIQLGAFSSPAGAHRAWDGVRGRLGGLQPLYGAAGAVTRLQAGPLPNRAAAERACAAAKAAGSACFPVAP